MKIRNERFVNVPLCATHCTMWYEACKHDFTCTDNWTRNFRWKNGTNHCPAGAPCFTFQQVYQSADNFCEKVTMLRRAHSSWPDYSVWPWQLL